MTALSSSLSSPLADRIIHFIWRRLRATNKSNFVVYDLPLEWYVAELNFLHLRLITDQAFVFWKGWREKSFRVKIAGYFRVWLKTFRVTKLVTIVLSISVHSRPQRPRSFWSAPRIATSGQVQRRKSAIHGLPVTLRSIYCCHSLNLLCLQIHSKPGCRWTWLEVAILGGDQKERRPGDKNDFSDDMPVHVCQATAC